MQAVGSDSLARVDKLEKAQPDGAGPCSFATAREVEVMVVFDLGAHHDLVEQVLRAGVLEMDGHHGAERWRVGHLDEDSARRDVARDRIGVPVQLAADDHHEGLIEAGMDAAVGRGSWPRCEISAVVFESLGQPSLHEIMISAQDDEVKKPTLSYIISTGGHEDASLVSTTMRVRFALRFAALAVVAAAPVGANAERSDPAFLGVGMGDYNGQCKIGTITRNSGAQAAGLLPGDIFLAIDGTLIGRCDDLTREIQKREPSDKVELRILRNGASVGIPAQLSSRSELMRQRFVGKTLNDLHMITVADGRPTDVSWRGKTTIVGWYDANKCVGCDRVFTKLGQWVKSRKTNSQTYPLLALAATAGNRERSDEENVSQLKHEQRLLEVPLLYGESDTYSSISFGDDKRVIAMVVDCHGVVQHAMPIKPDADDVNALLEELTVAADQAARPPRAR